MRSAAAAIAVLAAACYAPQPQAGAPCAADGSCPRPLVCSPRGTCEAPGGIDVDAPPPPPPLPDGCTPTAEICGNGIDDECNGVVDNGC
jgi:hypothetical protein